MKNYQDFFFLSLLLLGIATVGEATEVHPMQCSGVSSVKTCDSYLYALADGLSPAAVALLYSANVSLVEPIVHPPKTEADYLVQVQCRCADTGNGSAVYSHSTRYTVKPGDTAYNITGTVFSGLAFGVNSTLLAEESIDVRLACACYGGHGGRVVSYAVQQGDTLSTIASLFSADQGLIRKMNAMLATNPEFLVPGWVLFVPMGSAAPPPNTSNGKKNNATLISAISVSLAFLVIGSAFLLYRCRNQRRNKSLHRSNIMSKNLSVMESIAALESQYLPKKGTHGER